MTGQTSLIYKGSDGTGRIINPSNYAAVNHNHNGVYQPAGSYAAASHTHTGTEVTINNSTQTVEAAINNNYSMIVNANNEISSLKSSVSSGKTQIASAITDKGVSTAASATFSQMASNIRNIAQGLNARYIAEAYISNGNSTTFGEYDVTGFLIYNTVYINDFNTYTNPIRRFNRIQLEYPRISTGSIRLFLYNNGTLSDSLLYYSKGTYPSYTRVLFIENISDSDKTVFINNGFRFYDFASSL